MVKRKPKMPSKTPSRNRQEQQRIQPHNQQQEQQENVPPCCAQIRHENELLRRALRKERERRMFTTNAYRQLLEQFNHLVDFRRVVASGGGDRRSLANGGDLQSMANEDDHRSVLNGDEHRSFAKGGDDHRSVAKGDDDHRSVLSVNNDHRSFGKGDDDHRSFGKGDDHRSVLSGDEHRSFVKGVDDHRSVETAVHRSVAQGNDRKTLTDNWYFVALDRVDSRNSKGNCSREFSNDDSSELLRDQRVWQMFTRSQQRCKAIRDASRVRAQIAAGRRAVVADLVTGRRALDSEAIDVLLHTDASRVVQAFPPSFMREQRRASRRSYERSPHRMQQERERQRHFEGAINRILAHSSATVAKMIATSENGGISRRPR